MLAARSMSACFLVGQSSVSNRKGQCQTVRICMSQTDHLTVSICSLVSKPQFVFMWSNCFEAWTRPSFTSTQTTDEVSLIYKKSRSCSTALD
jgi:hypothetical protein